MRCILSAMLPLPRGLHHAAVAVPPVCDFFFTPHRASALGARIVGHLLRARGIEVSFFDFPSRRPGGAMAALPDALEYLRPYLLPGETGKQNILMVAHLDTVFEEEEDYSVTVLPDQITGPSVALNCGAPCWLVKKKIQRQPIENRR
jgi:hypothetical protein